MGLIPRAVSCASKTFFVGLIVFIVACNPAIYKTPSENFQTATVSLKNAYFLQWEVSNKARIERGDIADQIAIWVAPPNVEKSAIEAVIKNMTKRRQKDIHEDLKPLREKAFAALEGYAEVLVGLASDEPTEAIVSEINGLVQDIEGVLNAVSQMQIVTKNAEIINSFAGPLQQYVGVLNEIIRLASNVIRHRTIVKTIGKSNDSVVELITVLKTEAVAARTNAQSQIKTARKQLDSFLGSSRFTNADNSLKAKVAERISVLKAIEDNMHKDDIDKAFDAALKAQGALVKKALLKDPKDWTIAIRAFRERVAATEEAIEKINSEM